MAKRRPVAIQIRVPISDRLPVNSYRPAPIWEVRLLIYWTTNPATIRRMPTTAPTVESTRRARLGRSPGCLDLATAIAPIKDKTASATPIDVRGLTPHRSMSSDNRTVYLERPNGRSAIGRARRARPEHPLLAVTVATRCSASPASSETTGTDRRPGREPQHCQPQHHAEQVPRPSGQNQHPPRRQRG
jgi:hypothetical protein